MIYFTRTREERGCRGCGAGTHVALATHGPLVDPTISRKVYLCDDCLEELFQAVIKLKLRTEKKGKE